jgi:cytochrome c-type biogenesis protein CcmH
MMHALILAAVLLAAPLNVPDKDAAYANSQLRDPGQEERAKALMLSLRCIQCQGQSIADSDAPIAQAMRGEVRARIERGESADSIRDWMISRYGDWVSYDPPLSGVTALLWLTPLLLLAAGIWASRGLFRKVKP